MATSSFYKSFVVRDQKAAQKFRKALGAKHPIFVVEKNLNKEFKRSIDLLKSYSFN
jgi:hypothetical protein